MPREARKKSSTGIYHVMLRGINKQIIFEDHEDAVKFIDVLKNYKAVSGYELFAYCLMGNHIHLLIRVGKEDLPQIMKRIAGSYVYWYNWKYGRSGHLFQDRYKSEPVEDDATFLTVLRYIHQNPVKAKLCEHADQYELSSYREYLNSENEIVDAKMALDMVGREQFIKFHHEKNEDICLDITENTRLNDIDAQKIILKTSRCKNLSEFIKLEPIKRDKYIKSFKEQGLSIRQISRLTGVSKGIVERI